MDTGSESQLLERTSSYFTVGNISNCNIQVLIFETLGQTECQDRLSMEVEAQRVCSSIIRAGETLLVTTLDQDNKSIILFKMNMPNNETFLQLSVYNVALDRLECEPHFVPVDETVPGCPSHTSPPQRTGVGRVPFWVPAVVASGMAGVAVGTLVTRLLQ